MSAAAPGGSGDAGSAGATSNAPGAGALGAVAESLLSSWPATAAGAAARQRAAGEVERFTSGSAASLPFRARDAVAWVTVAPTSADLQRETDLLRAWVLPSYAWADPKQPFVAPEDATSPLARALVSASPAGYFRWWCSAADYEHVADRLARMRALAAKRPEHLYERTPSLLELRQQFRLALLTGARDAAEAAIRAIDHHQLDSALNTHLMRVRLLDQFGDYGAIRDDPATERLLGMRLPTAVRSALIRAYHAGFVAPYEPDGAGAAAVAYRDRAHPTVGGLVALAQPSDGPEVARDMAYRAWTLDDARAAADLLPTADAFVASLLRDVIHRGAMALAPDRAGEPAEDDAARAFRDALGRGDLRAVQALAPALLSRLTVRESRGEVADAVRQSLEVLPNAAVAAAVAAASATTEPVRLPQTWAETLQRLRDGDTSAVERFLALDHEDRPGPEGLTADDRAAAVATLEELLTAPTSGPGSAAHRLIDVALPAFVEDFVSEPQFPRPALTPLYLQLLRLWAEHKRGSASEPDGQLLLALAAAVLRGSAGAQEEVAHLLVAWWRARPVRAALAFLLEALETILDLTGDDGAAQQLWLDGAALASRGSDALTPGERAMWRRLGRRVGFDAAAVEEVVPAQTPDAEAGVPADPIRNAGLRKVAIVSLHRRAADEAAAVITERCGATVVVVDELVAGSATRNAQSADVVLFVWAAAKHAVFRAFDAVRSRVAYVQGSGAASIVLALERWAAKQAAEARPGAA